MLGFFLLLFFFPPSFSVSYITLKDLIFWASFEISAASCLLDTVNILVISGDLVKSLKSGHLYQKIKKL